LGGAIIFWLPSGLCYNNLTSQFSPLGAEFTHPDWCTWATIRHQAKETFHLGLFLFFLFGGRHFKNWRDNDKQHTNNHHAEINMVVEMLL
jgi:hypothetical protein